MRDAHRGEVTDRQLASRLMVGCRQLLHVAAAALVTAMASAGCSDDSSGNEQAHGPTCDELAQAYAAAFDEVTTCDPGSGSAQCIRPTTDNILCGCHAYANPEHAEALTELSDLHAAFFTKKCGQDVVCGVCPSATHGECSDAGLCTPIFPTGRGCTVGTETYQNGAVGIPDPISCNTCVCNDGRLDCGTLDCPEPCPEGTAFGSQCDTCGPVDDCQVVQFGCFGLCGDACTGPGAYCVQGLCVREPCG